MLVNIPAFSDEAIITEQDKSELSQVLTQHSFSEGFTDDGSKSEYYAYLENPKTGEAAKLFAVKNDQSITENDVISFCRERLTNYKVPKQISFIDELPKSAVGKLLRRELRNY